MLQVELLGADSLTQDVGIATFLILLWKDTYKDEDGGDEHGPQDSASEPWKRWPRPPGGFVDMGCALPLHPLISRSHSNAHHAHPLSFTPCIPMIIGTL